MYNEFFGFEKNPFAAKPDAAFFYRSKQHDAALRGLIFAVQARMGLVSLTGEEGTGKTTVLDRLHDSLETNHIPCAFLRDPRISPKRFFQTIASDLDLQCKETSAYQVFSALHQLTIQQARQGRTVALIVDDAYHLPAEVFNEVLHLASLHDDKVKLLQTVFAGREELHATLDALNLDRLKQRAILSCRLNPFAAGETKEYIEFRLAQAGMPEQTVFSPEAIAEVHERSRGFAPAIHQLCESLLLAAYSASSKICTQEILDQVFRKPQGNQSQILETTATVVAVTIDLPYLPSRPEPEPPAMQTALLRLTFDLIPGLPPPLPVSSNQRLDPDWVALGWVFPAWSSVLPIAGLAASSKKPMRFVDGAKTAPSPRRDVQPLPSSSIVSEPVVSKPVLSKPVVFAEPRPDRKLKRLTSKKAARPLSQSAALATAIDFPGSIPQASNSASEARNAGVAPRTPKVVNQLEPVALSAKSSTGILKQDPEATSLQSTGPLCPGHPVAGFLPPGAPRMVKLVSLRYVTPVPPPASGPAGANAFSIPRAPFMKPTRPTANLQPIGARRGRITLVRLPIRLELADAVKDLRDSVQPAIDFTQPPCRPQASGYVCQTRTPLFAGLRPLECEIDPRQPLVGSPAGSHLFSIPCEPVPEVTLPAGEFQLMATGERPRVPVTPFELAKHDPPSPRASAGMELDLANPGNPIKPGIDRDLTASCEPNVRERDDLQSLPCRVTPSAPPAEKPANTFLSAVPSLRAWRPALKLAPVNHLRPSLLLRPISNRLDMNPATLEAQSLEPGKPSPSHRKWILNVAIALLTGIALYSVPPAIRTAVGFMHQGWQGTHQAILDRAAVTLKEDFRSGLDDWMNRGGARPSWASDAAGFVHPAALALYRPSLGLVDYQLQFVGTIDKKGLSWVVRAADFNNYYAVRLTVLKPGPTPTIGVTRYAVINAKTQNQVTTPLLLSARTDTVYRVSLDVRGDRYVLSVQDQPVDSWSEPMLKSGGIGFFSETDAGSRVAAVQVRGQDDMLGRLLARVVPSGIPSYRTAMNERAAMILAAEMKPASLAGRTPRGSTPPLDPAFWQVPEVAVAKKTKHCPTPTTRVGAVRTIRRTSPYARSEYPANCY